MKRKTSAKHLGRISKKKFDYRPTLKNTIKKKYIYTNLTKMFLHFYKNYFNMQVSNSGSQSLSCILPFQY